MPQFLSYMKYPGNFLQGGITASIQAGSFAGSLLTGAFLADRLGRRRTLLLGSLIFTIGVAISTASNNVIALVAGRVINGLGNGCLAMMVCPEKKDGKIEFQYSGLTAFSCRSHYTRVKLPLLSKCRHPSLIRK